MRTRIRDVKKVATCAELGPRFLHSTGQAYKGGPNSGVFITITANPVQDVDVPGAQIQPFGVVEEGSGGRRSRYYRERGRLLPAHSSGQCVMRVSLSDAALEAALSGYTHHAAGIIGPRPHGRQHCAAPAESGARSLLFSIVTRKQVDALAERRNWPAHALNDFKTAVAAACDLGHAARKRVDRTDHRTIERVARKRRCRHRWREYILQRRYSPREVFARTRHQMHRCRNIGRRGNQARYCMLIGGDKAAVDRLDPIFQRTGAGHGL